MEREPVVLTGRLVRLEPLRMDHHDALVEATRDGGLFNIWFTNVPDPAAMRTRLEEYLQRQESGEMMPFTVSRISDGTVLGLTAFYDITPEVPRASIGYTWNRVSAQGSGTNADSKLLLLRHAFDAWACEGVCFKTSWHNARSRAAIERLGARCDGVMRADMRHRDGSLRDSVVYSILAHEWPAVRSGLQQRVGL